MSTSSRRALAAALVVLASGATTACGGGAEARESAHGRRAAAESAIRRVHHQWLKRIAAGDARACRLLTAKARADMVTAESGACFYAVARFAATITAEERAGFSKVRVRRIAVRGSRAVIADRDLATPPELAGLMAVDGPMVLRRIGRRWLIDDVG
jgi:hypothetical protein